MKAKKRKKKQQPDAYVLCACALHGDGIIGNEGRMLLVGD